VEDKKTKEPALKIIDECRRNAFKRGSTSGEVGDGITWQDYAPLGDPRRTF